MDISRWLEVLPDVLDAVAGIAAALGSWFAGAVHATGAAGTLTALVATYLASNVVVGATRRLAWRLSGLVEAFGQVDRSPHVDRRRRPRGFALYRALQAIAAPPLLLMRLLIWGALGCVLWTAAGGWSALGPQIAAVTTGLPDVATVSAIATLALLVLTLALSPRARASAAVRAVTEERLLRARMVTGRAADGLAYGVRKCLEDVDALKIQFLEEVLACAGVHHHAVAIRDRAVSVTSRPLPGLERWRQPRRTWSTDDGDIPWARVFAACRAELATLHEEARAVDDLGAFGGLYRMSPAACADVIRAARPRSAVATAVIAGGARDSESTPGLPNALRVIDPVWWRQVLDAQRPGSPMATLDPSAPPERLAECLQTIGDSIDRASGAAWWFAAQLDLYARTAHRSEGRGLSVRLASAGAR